MKRASELLNFSMQAWRNDYAKAMTKRIPAKIGNAMTEAACDGKRFYVISQSEHEGLDFRLLEEALLYFDYRVVEIVEGEYPNDDKKLRVSW